jgi:phage tail tube protein FII
VARASANYDELNMPQPQNAAAITIAVMTAYVKPTKRGTNLPELQHVTAILPKGGRNILAVRR